MTLAIHAGLSPGGATIAGVTGVILAGGASSRMGSNKALLPYRGGVFVEAIFRQLKRLFPDVLLVTNTPEQYQFLPCRKVPDLFPGHGALAGIHAGLYHCATEAIFVVACDMPYLNPMLIRAVAGHQSDLSDADAGSPNVADAAGASAPPFAKGGKGGLALLDAAADVVMPRSDSGLEPLHALYRKACLPAIEASLLQGRRRIVSFLPFVKVCEIPPPVVALLDPGYASFSNINTPEQYHQLREAEKLAYTKQKAALQPTEGDTSFAAATS